MSSHSYCANYYGSINCHNTVMKFGDRCALCTVRWYSERWHYKLTKAQAQKNYINTSSAELLENGLPQANQQWVENVKREQLRREEEKSRRARVSRTSSGMVR
ncbi:hypothetical protein MBM_07548 [Drepanopeziza brunnea f. sp. 'multigermtubi' MB_m1]|uniref:Uncharacterized protein n=1 Tax=Marssonina brunnea f. sp. multigermtubi (strain MB_m1) TaxID=1072389 RepID=K1X0B5_MARBU|nr:uncharacterized protein MBM_07548 [Drepanopeziza brunnea f. sp. 'multigermtubi' MB_m1]EKD14318.1 hypothetical protein MBM_07548 [Drepanopeziza brunnea f. sp. 'multigermtubi' MB_m1]